MTSLYPPMPLNSPDVHDVQSTIDMDIVKLQSLLKQIPLSVITTTSRNAITIPYNATISEALEILRNGGIQAAPIAGEDRRTSPGFLTLQDIIAFIMSKHSPQQPRSLKNVSATAESHVIQLHSVLARDVVGHGRIELPWMPLEEDSTIYDVIEMFSLGHLQRVPIIAASESNAVSSHHSPKCVLSHSKILMFLSGLCQKSQSNDSIDSKILPKLRQSVKRIFQQSLESLGLVNNIVDNDKNNTNSKQISCRRPICLSDTSTALDAFSLMFESGTTSVLIVDTSNNGRVLGSLHASALKGLSNDPFHDLFLPIPQFLSQIWPEALGQTITVSPRISLGAVVKECLRRHTMVVYVVDGGRDGAPIGVVTTSDIMALIARGEEL